MEAIRGDNIEAVREGKMPGVPEGFAISKIISDENGAVIPIMHRIQEELGFLPEEILRELAAEINVPLIELFRIAVFYKHFKLTPSGKHQIITCAGTACHVRGGKLISREISRILGIEPGETSSDGEYTLEEVGCLGACALAPLVVIDGEYHGNMNPLSIGNLLKKDICRKTECACSSNGSK